MFVLSTTMLVALLLLAYTASRSTSGPTAVPIDHIIVIYQENHTFDNLFGTFPGANGLERASAMLPQSSKTGEAYRTLPQPIDTGRTPRAPDPRFPANLPNSPFPIDRYVPPDQPIPDPVHTFYLHQLQINVGKMDRFVAWSDAGGLTMGYYDTTQLPLYRYAREYVLLDNFFQGAFGGSFLNHFWLVCACTPVWPNAPVDLIAEPRFDADGILVDVRREGPVTPDGFAIDLLYSVNQPHPVDERPDHLLPAQTAPTIGDRLSAAGVTWAWYAGGWNDAVSGKPDPMFRYHHQPFVYFRAYGDDAPAGRAHLKDERDFFEALGNGTLPSVSFVKPIGRLNEHPGNTVLLEGQRHVADLIERVRSSPYWPRTAIIVTYDEYGGFWDHVPPPKGDRWGPGTRVPTVIISPLARKGFVDHTRYDTTSILAFIEWRFGLEPLSVRDRSANNLLAAFDASAKSSALMTISRQST